MINDASLVMIPSGYKDGKLYSVKPTNGDGDFTFSRGSNLAATRVNSEGLIEKGRENLLLQSNTFDTTWLNQLGTGGTITGGQVGYDGTNDAWLISKDTSTFRSVRQIISSSGVQTFSTYVKSGTLTNASLRIDATSTIIIDYNLSLGTISGTSGTHIDSDIEDIGNGWYRISVTFNSSITNVHIYADKSGTTSGNIYIQDAQLELGLVATEYIETTTTTAQAGILEDMPRLNYGTCPSLLLEPQRTNIATNSEYMLGFSKGAASSLESNAAISPDGKSNATYFYCNTTTTNAYLLPSFSGTSGVQYAVSFYAKAKELNRVYIKNVNDSGGQSWFDLSDGTYNLLSGIDSMRIESVGNGWYRCVAISTSTSTAIKWIPILKGDANEGVYVYGLQIEQGSYPTSYIPTYGASVTRGEDTLSALNITSIVTGISFTWFLNLNEWQGSDTNVGDLFLSNLSGGQIQLRVRTDGYRFFYLSINAGTLYPIAASQTARKFCIKYDGSNFKLFRDGVLEATTASVGDTDWSGLSQSAGGSTLPLDQLLIFNSALSDDECIALTS